jgi:hypothetical protein
MLTFKREFETAGLPGLTLNALSRVAVNGKNADVAPSLSVLRLMVLTKTGAVCRGYGEQAPNGRPNRATQDSNSNTN